MAVNPHTLEQLESRIKELEQANRLLENKIDTEIKNSRKQEQLMMQQSKMVAMGQMVAAIAHQWRQPLTSVGFILQNIQTAYHQGKLDARYLNKSVEDAMTQVNTMSKTIDDLRIFLRPDSEKRSFDLLKAISETLSILNAQCLNNSILCRFNGTRRDSITVTGYPDEFKQVLINIISNGTYAILKKIEQGSLDENKGEITIDVLRRADKVVVKIFNNGIPIPRTLMERMFEPLYTTKDKAKGVGVGLYMAKTIIESNMGGRIFARNIKDGVVFIIQLKTGH